MLDLILIGILVAIIAGAALYIYKEKKKGAACIGCPHADKCTKCDCKK